MEIQNIPVSLIVSYENGKEAKVQFKKEPRKETTDTIDLALLDYMLSSFGSLERYIEEATAPNHRWILSKNVTLKIVGVDGTEYPLPFDTKYHDIIFKASEAVLFNGKTTFIEKGEGTHMVSKDEFHHFFNDFLAGILSDTGYRLLEGGYFKEYPSFETLLRKYYQLNQKEDDIYADAQMHSMETNALSTAKSPKTIEDYLRNYSIFRMSISFNRTCFENKKLEEKEPKKGKPQSFNTKRSLCYIVGNNCEPLVLKTMEAKDLDDYTIEHYIDRKQIIRENREIIEAYILKHQGYVKRIREASGNPKYSGQLTILEHNVDGGFKRLPSGKYMCFPILYTDAFKSVHNLYCDIDKFRREAKSKKMKLQSLENQIQSTQANMLYNNLEQNLKEVLEKLEEEKRVTKEELEKVMLDINRIIRDMQELEQQDYLAAKNKNYHRLFSEHQAKEIRFTKSTRIKASYKKTLDEWAKAIENSTYRYDNIRSILHYLRKKEGPIFQVKEKVAPKIEPSASPTEPAREDEFLTLAEVNRMYDGEIPSQAELERKNIRVQK